MSNSRKHSSKLHWDKRLWVLGLLVVAGAIFALLQLSNTTHFFNSHPTTIYSPNVPTAGPTTKDQTGASAIPSSNGSSSGKLPNVSTNNSTPSGTTLIAPTGGFVNSHHPSLSDKKLSQMFSVCNTTPGASCEITFTNASSGISKTLTAQSADSGGAAYWSWTLQELGLTQGTWKTTATASYNGQTKSATDPTDLEVQP